MDPEDPPKAKPDEDSNEAEDEESPEKQPARKRRSSGLTRPKEEKPTTDSTDDEKPSTSTSNKSADPRDPNYYKPTPLEFEQYVETQKLKKRYLTARAEESTSDSENDATQHKIGDLYKHQGMIYGVGGSKNTCTTDPFLTSIKIWTLRDKYDFSSNFRHTSGLGLELENHIRRMMDCLEVTEANPNMTPREKAVLESKDLNRMWVWARTGRIPLDPVNFLGCHEENVLEALTEVSKLEYKNICGCDKQEAFKQVSHVYIPSQTWLDEFSRQGLVPEQRIKFRICQDCKQNYTSITKIPQTTWVLIFIYPRGDRFQGKNSLQDNLPTLLTLGEDKEDLFTLAYSTYVRRYASRKPKPPQPQPMEVITISDSSDDQDVIVLDKDGNPEPKPNKTKSPPQTFTTQDPDLEVLGHVISRIHIKNAWFHYDDMARSGMLTYVGQRIPAKLDNTSLVSTVYYRVPQLRRPVQDLISHDKTGKEGEKRI